MAMYLGSFMNGLFSGAQSAASLYGMYEGIMQQAEWKDAADKVKAARESDAAWAEKEQVVSRLRGQYGTPGAEQPATPTQTTPAAPVPATPSPGQTAPGTADPTKVVTAGQAIAGDAPGNAPNRDTGTGLPAPTQLLPRPVEDGAVSPATPTPAPTDDRRRETLTAPLPRPEQRPLIPPTRTPGVGGIPTAAQPFVNPTTTTPPVDPNAPYTPAPLPRVPNGGGTAPVNTPIPRGPVGAPVIPQAQTPYLQAPAGPPNPNAPPPDQGIPWYPQAVPFTPPQQGGTAPVGTPIPSAPVGGPYTPPPQMGGAAVGGTGSDTGIGGRPLSWTPPAPAPMSAGERLLQALNPVGSAQAAGSGGSGAPPTDWLPAGSAPPPNRNTRGGTQVGLGAPAPAAPPAPAAAPPPTAAPAPAPAPAAPAQAGPVQTPGPYNGVAAPPAPTGVTPPNPPSAAPATTPPAPVVVSGQQGQVAPNQQGPSVQSEATPPVLSPPVSPSAWTWLVQKDPALARMVEETISEVGSGISKFDVAAIIRRESGGDAKAVGGNGRGLMQIEPGAQKDVDPEMKLDPFNPKHNLILGIKYMQQLAIDNGLGTGSMQMHVAYMRGPGGLARLQQIGWEAWAKENPIAAKGVLGLYDDKVTPTTGMFPGGRRMDAKQIVTAANDGPDGLLNYVATQGPPGVGMSDRWRSVQATLEHAAIRSGRFEMLGPIQDWVAQQSHQGAVSNMLAAYQALASGNGAGAATALARAHAFFPDDSYGRFGVDKQGRLWGQQISEVTGEPLGKHFQITPDILAQQILTLQNPRNFIEVLQKYQSTNADIVLKKAHADYYKAMPEVALQKQQMATELALTKQENTNQQNALKEQGRVQRQEDTQKHQAEMAATRAENAKEINTTVDKYYGPDAAVPKGTTPEVWAAESEAFRSLISPPSVGGAGMGPPQAQSVARQLREKKLGISRMAKPDGSQVDVIHGANEDPTKGQGKTTVSTQQGDRLRASLGIPAVAGSEPIQPPAATGRQQRAQGPVGVGIGSPTAMANNTFTGLPVRPMQQQALA